jgi:hypothetical protein
MDEIQYMLKPDWVSWAAIKECFIKAHESNRKKGVVMQNQFMTPEEFEKAYKDAYFFVALHGEEVIGTSAFFIRKMNKWWARNKKVIYNCGDAIIPEYKGTDVYTDLLAFRAKYIEKTGIRIMWFDTAEDNKLVQKLTMRKGAKKVQLYASPKTWYYSVVMVKWMDGCPYSDWYCNFRFKLSSFIVKLIWKPGKKVRFLPSKGNSTPHEMH